MVLVADTAAPEASEPNPPVYGVQATYDHADGQWVQDESGEISWVPYKWSTPEPPRPWTDDEIRNPVEPGSYGAGPIQRWVRHEPRKPWFPNMPHPIADTGKAVTKSTEHLAIICIAVCAVPIICLLIWAPVKVIQAFAGRGK